MKLYPRSSIALTTLALCLVFATAASATPLTPNSSAVGAQVVPPPTPVPGPFLKDTGVQPFSVGLITGTYEEVVFMDQFTGGLDFVYAIHNNTSSGLDAIGRSTTTDFTGFSTNVGFDTTATNLLGNTPTQKPLFVDRSGSGDSIGFQFAPPSPLVSTFIGGTDSFNLVIETDALYVTSGVINFIDGGAAGFPGYAPLLTPEPSSYLLMGTGMLICAFFLRRNMGTSAASITTA
jgi:hypothetical protein